MSSCKRFGWIAFTAVSLSVLGVLPACAGWQANGSPVCTATGDQEQVVIATDDEGGAILVWSDYRSPEGHGNSDLFAQRVTSNGDIAPGWPADGLAVCTATGHQSGKKVVPDAAGGVIVFWEDNRADPTYSTPYAVRITGAGALAPGWPVDGMPVCGIPNGLSYLAADSDGAGGAFVAWTDIRSSGTTGTDIYVQRLTGQGTIAPGWPADGVPVCTELLAQQYPDIESDGSGGVLVTWQDKRNGSDRNIFAQRLTAAGLVAPGWTANGVPVCQASSDQLYPAIASDTRGGAIISWHDGRNVPVSFFDVYAQRILGDGSIAPGWPADGALLCTNTANQMFTQIVPDGSGGALVNWRDDRSGSYDLYLQRITAAGTFAPGWPADGFATGAAPGNQTLPGMIPDTGGGAILAWNDQRTSTEIYSLRVTGDGALADGWQQDGLLVATGSFPAVCSDGAGGAIIGWQDARTAGNDIFAARVSGSGRMATDAAVREQPRIALAPCSPNPFASGVRLQFSNSAPAALRVDIFDVAGRHVRSLDRRTFAPGTHVLVWDGKGDDATVRSSGTYFVRLRGAGVDLRRKLVRAE